jgi:single-strand DNA-binding protein
MSNDLNKTILVGRLTKDAELRFTPSGTPVCSFSIANGRSWKQGDEKKESVSYFNCVLWGKIAESVNEYLKKGTQLAIEGRLSQQRWQDESGNNKSKIEIVVDTFQFLGGKKESGEGQSSSGPAPEGAAGKVQDGFGGQDIPNFEENPFSDSDIPF